MSINQNHSPTRKKSPGLAMQVGNKRRALHPSRYPGFFIGFPGGGIGIGCVVIDGALGKGPMAVPGAHQEELQFTAAHPITHGCYVNSLGIGSRAITRIPPGCPADLSRYETVCEGHRLVSSGRVIRSVNSKGST